TTTITATTTGLTTNTATTATITITGYATANKLAVTGSIATHTLTATVQDTYGNTVTGGTDSTPSVTFTQGGSGTAYFAGGTSTSTSVTAVAGVATATKVNPRVVGNITFTATATLNGGGKSGTLADTVALNFNAIASTTSAADCSAGSRCVFSGGGATAGSTLTVTVCTTNSFPCGDATPITATVSVSSAGTWTTGNSGTLTNGVTYYIQVTQNGATGHDSFSVVRGTKY
ncbi:MAG: hypothetical protein WCI22_02105, partial [Actinomycetota bacterium]